MCVLTVTSVIYVIISYLLTADALGINILIYFRDLVMLLLNPQKAISNIKLNPYSSFAFWALYNDQRCSMSNIFSILTIKHGHDNALDHIRQNMESWNILKIKQSNVILVSRLHGSFLNDIVDMAK